MCERVVNSSQNLFYAGAAIANRMYVGAGIIKEVRYIQQSAGAKDVAAGTMLFFSFTIVFLLHLLLFATAPMVTVIMEEMHLSHADFGLVYSAAIISLIVFRIPWGLIGDRIG